MTTSPEAVIAVFELRPYWGPELQRQFVSTDVSIRECRSFRNLIPSIDGIRPALIVIDIDAALNNCLNWLGSDLKDYANSYPIVACGSQTTIELEWILREAGVTVFLPNVIPGDDFARICRRQLGFVRRGIGQKD